jgi:pyruvoyl-dependent arginine decarboxylase (PvlArgDC)
MEGTTKIIAVVRGASNAEIQAIFRALADKWVRDIRLAGLVAEHHGLADRYCQAGYLRNLTTGARFSIFSRFRPRRGCVSP